MGQGALNYQGVKSGIKLNDIIEDFKYVYKGQTIKAGDLVNYINGVAKQISTTETEISNITGTGANISATLLTDNKIFIAHSYGEANLGSSGKDRYLYGVVVEIRETEIIVGTDTYLNTTIFYGYLLRCLKLSDGRVLVAHSYNDYVVNGLVVTVNGFEVQFSINDTLIAPRGAYAGCELTLLNDGKVFVGYDNTTDKHYAYARILTISTSISLGTATDLSESNAFSGAEIKVLTLPDGKVLYVHTNNDSNRYIRGKVCTISGTTITVSYKANLITTSGAGNNFSLCSLPDNKFFMAYGASAGSNASALYCVIGVCNSSNFGIGTSVLAKDSYWAGLNTNIILYKDNYIFITHVNNKDLRDVAGLVVKFIGTTISEVCTDIIMSEEYYSSTGSLIMLDDKKLFYIHNKTQDQRLLSSQIFVMDEENDIVSNKITEYEQQVTQALENSFDAVALSDGVGAPEFVEGEVEVKKTGDIIPKTWTKVSDYQYRADGVTLVASSIRGATEYYPYYACDGNEGTDYRGAFSEYRVGRSLRWDFDTPQKITKMYVYIGTQTFNYMTDDYESITIQGSNTGTTDNDFIDLFSIPIAKVDEYKQEIELSNTDYYKYYRIKSINIENTLNVHEWYVTEYAVKEIQQIPSTEHNEQVKIARVYKEVEVEKTFTGDIFNKTWNEIVAYEQYQADDGTKLIADCISTNPAYIVTNAFDSDTSTRCAASENGASMKLEFIKPIKITKMKTWIDQNQSASFTVIIQGSNNDSEWTNLYTINSAQSKLTTIELNNTDFFKFYQMYIICSSASIFSFVRVYEWQTSEYIEKVTEVIQ